MKIKNKQVAKALMVSCILTTLLSGCKKEEIEVSIDSAPKKSKEIAKTYLLNNQVKTDNFDTELVYSKQDVLNKLEEYYHQCGIHYTYILANSTDSSINNELYVAALYMKLKNNFSSNDEIIKELEEIYFDITLQNQEDVIFFNYYYPLASFAHQHSCDANHTIEEYGILYCDKIDEVLEIKKFKDELEEDLALIGDENLTNAYNRFKNKPNFKDYLYELETLYAFASIPTDYHEEDIWNYYFLNLTSTLKDKESLYDIYYELARIAHTNCNYDHEYKGDGIFTCEGIRLIIDSRSYLN